MAEYFVDTNVLISCYDPSDPEKHGRAVDVLTRLARSGRGTLSAQVLGEFYVVSTERIPAPLSPTQASRSVTNYLRSWTIFDISAWTVQEAAYASERHQLNYWDALIWATAKLNRVPTILSEDFSDGRMLEGVRFLNPLTADFDRAVLG